MRTHYRHLLIAALLLLTAGTALSQRRTLFWVGGSGAWSDAAHWSLTEHGPGGAGIPGTIDDAVLRMKGEDVVRLEGNARCNNLRVDAREGFARFTGAPGNELRVHGDFVLSGSVHWAFDGTVRLSGDGEGKVIDARAIPLRGQLRFDGGGSWSIVSDLHLTDGDITWRAGTVHAAGALVRARTLCSEGRGAKRLMAGRSVIQLAQAPEPGVIDRVVEQQQAVITVGNAPISADLAIPPAGNDRDVVVCATGGGQTPFVATTSATTSYNGFNISCRGECDATITVNVTGGVGPFTYSWLFGGPNTQTWIGACGGPQIVVVTDEGQGVSCGVPINVTEPNPLGVIFFGAGSPPACADVCNGSRTALAIGGVAPHSYNWNNGAGTGSSFNQLCAGVNTLVITDANLCTFDTTFTFDLQPITPNLTFTDVTCNGVCDGTASVNPTGGTPAISVTWAPPPGAGQGTNNATGLCAGPYSVLLVDANGCDTTINFIINEPPPIVPNPAQTDASCFGICDGTATVNPSGGIGPYSYSWVPPPGGGQSTNAATGLCEGSYTVTITDQATNCITTQDFTIAAPPAIDVQGTLTPASCSDACDGEISLIISGVLPPFTITWSPNVSGQGTPNATALCPGDYSVTVATPNGCDTTLTFNVPSPPPLNAQLTPVDASCAGVCDGEASVTVSGGTAGYTYLWAPNVTGQGTPNVTGLCAGSYTLLVSDANGCDTLIAFTINEPPPIVVVPTQTDVTCGSSCDGTASVAVSGGAPGYTYLWTPNVTGQGTPNATDLCAGPYSVLITDANGCTITQAFTILDAVPLEVSLQVLPASCPDACDGSAGVIVTGGVGPYTYDWQPPPTGQGTPNVTGLCAQAYTLLITDAVGCDTLIAFTVPAPPPISVTSTVTDPSCSGDCNGSISVQASGGNGAFTYAWAPNVTGQGTPDATALCAGDYQVTITSGGCDTTLTFTLTDPPQIDAVLSTTDASCAGECDGTASVTVSGGNTPYSFVWAPNVIGQGTPDAIDLCPGNYTVLVSDALGCDTLIAFTIIEPPPLAVDLVTTPASCGGACDGTATASVSGGAGPYQYDWQAPPGAGQGTPNATDYCPGAYTLTVTDANGCTLVTPFAISTPSGIDAQFSTTPTSCGNDCDGTATVNATGGIEPYTWLWDPVPGGGQGTPNVTGLCQGIYTLQITDAAQCDTVLFINITGPTPIEPNASQTDEDCNGPCNGTATVNPIGGSGTYTFVWSPPPPAGQSTNSVSQLCPGIWSVTIDDGIGCDTTVVFDILPKVPIDNNVAWSDATCPNACDGTAQVFPTGGIPPYSYVWSPNPPVGQGTEAVSGLCLGLWSVTVIDAVGCEASTPFFVGAPPPFSAGLVVLPESCAGACTGSATVTPTGGSGSISISWSPPPGGGQGTTTATGLCAGITYSVTLIDSIGCDSTFTFTVDPFAPIEPNSSSTPVSCAGACDGTATVGPTGGTAPYTYMWMPGMQDTPQVTDLCEGVYTVTITDANNCSTDAQVIITGPPAIDANATVTPISCNGQCDASIVLNTAGGTGNYTYTWAPIPPNGQGQSSATNLCSGTWDVVITDDSGCSVPFSFDLTEPDALTLSVASTTSECQVCIGTATATVGGGTDPLSVEWYSAGGSLVGAGTSITDLCAGVYTVVVTDANGCTLQQAVPITDSAGEDITANDGSTSCPNTCDGGVSVDFVCADAPCAIAWFDAQGNDLNQNGNSLSNLCPGDYLVQVTNASGCVSVDTATVVAPAPTELLISSTPVSCAGDCDGTATVGVNGGTPPFTWTWSPEPGGGQGTPLATGLCAGVYTVLIIDDGGCDTTAQVLITEPLPIAIDAVVTGITCAGDCNGSIALTITGGTQAYTVVWNPVPPNGQGVLTATDLCAGQYTATVTDANGCTSIASYDVIEPQPLLVSVSTTPSTCPDCDGQATATITGGTAPYAVNWFLGGALVGTGESISNLCGGLYTVEVTDDNGCAVSQVVQVSDSNAEALTPVNGQTTCGNSCDGSVSVSFVCTTPPCNLVWFDAGGNVIAVNEGMVDSLCVGVYTAQVTNGSGCVSFTDAEVVPSQTIVPNLSSTPVSCAGACDGTATVGPTGGIEPYTFIWSPGGQSTPQVTGLCAGVYEVLIADSTGCDTTVQVLITEPQPLDATATVEDALCTGDCNGSISVIVTGGTQPYIYAWSPNANGQGTPTITDLCPGTYTLTVTDANGCSLTLDYTVNEPQPLQATVSTTLSECGLCNGTASVAITGGTPLYFITWMSGASIIGTGDTITDLCAGFYDAIITDANGCSITELVAISDADGEQLTMTDGITSCPGDCDGVVSVDYACSQPPCTTAWFDADGNDLNEPGNTLSNLCAGLYLVQVTNGIGCITIDTAFVTEPDPIVANLSTTPAICAGFCDGTATVGPSGGQGPYEILWQPSGEITPTITGLCAGQISVTITDAAGCSITQDVLILEPQPLSLTDTITPITCNGACDGSITVVATGGIQPYAYLWSPTPPGDPTQPGITGLCAGDWTVTVTDANGCTLSETFTLVDPPVLDAQVITTDNLCFGDCEGTAGATINGGVAPYAIAWADASGNIIASDTLDVSSLCAGDYTLTVADANGCVLSVPFTITQGDAIEANLLWTNETCFGPCDGTASITPSGGAEPYAIDWRDPDGNLIAQDVTDVSGLCAGTNTVTITDALGCDTTYAFTVLPYTTITDNATVTNVQCNGDCDGSIVLNANGGIGAYTYTWDPVPPNGQGSASATALCPGTYTVTITDGAGCSQAFSYAITEPPVLNVAVDQVVDASCATASDGAITVTASGGTPGYTFSWSGPGGFNSSDEDISNLAPGSYTLTLTDDNGCAFTITVDVGALATVIADAGPDQTECSGVGVTLDGTNSTGAVTYAWFDDQGELISGSPVLDLGGLAPGTYTFTLTVSDGPCSDSDQVTVTILDLPIADAGPDQVIFLSETAQLGGAPTGPAGSTFNWQPDSLLNNGSTADPIADTQETTWFTVLVTAPNGCVALDSVLVTVVPEVVITNGFTPNGDGWNDAWVIDYINLFPECEVEIYNRWGDMLFRSVGYKTPWDGRYSGGFVPVGTYYYVIKLNDPRFPEPYTGPLTVIR